MSAAHPTRWPRPEAQSALVVLVPEAEPLIGPLRAAHDPAAAAGIPAHVTTLYPFVPPERLDEAILRSAASCFRALTPFNAALTGLRRFPGVLYLTPEPSGPFRALTLAAWKAFPDLPPYEGRHPDIIPHLTLAATPDEATLSHLADTFETTARPRLPLPFSVRQVTLLTNRSGPWRSVATFPLGGA